ncbi:MAG: hypothetical protein K2X66_15650, partial [Cyanobacteria bacterium]|nr:hypothetical protein [Cyanobacteriota bacterium]
IMLGCFTETSVSNTAFAHLSPLVDYADLDGSLLLAKDPFDGIQFEGNQICLPHRPGIGVVSRNIFNTIEEQPLLTHEKALN